MDLSENMSVCRLGEYGLRGYDEVEPPCRQGAEVPSFPEGVVCGRPAPKRRNSLYRRSQPTAAPRQATHPSVCGTQTMTMCRS